MKKINNCKCGEEAFLFKSTAAGFYAMCPSCFEKSDLWMEPSGAISEWNRYNRKEEVENDATQS